MSGISPQQSHFVTVDNRECVKILTKHKNIIKYEKLSLGSMYDVSSLVSFVSLWDKFGLEFFLGFPALVSVLIKGRSIERLFYSPSSSHRILRRRAQTWGTHFSRISRSPAVVERISRSESFFSRSGAAVTVCMVNETPFRVFDPRSFPSMGQSCQCPTPMSVQLHSRPSW